VRLEIGACLGPCAAACTHTAYSDQLRRARAFLDGEAGPHLAAIEGSMAEAAAAFDFERAAVLRDRLDALQWLHRHLERLRQARERYSFIYPVSGYGGEDRWYLIHQGRVAAALAAPHDDTSRQAAMSRIEQVYHQAGPRSLAASPDEVSGVLLVAAWFRKHPEELERAMEPERYC
jgi:excinuclease ABC subunit C